MTDDEAVINEAQKVVEQAVSKAAKAQSKEHIAALPQLYRMAMDLIRKEGSYEPYGVSLFAIRESKASVDKDDIPNPLGVPLDKSIAAEFVLTHTFSNLGEAADSLRSIVASILFWESSKKRPTSLVLVTRDNLCVNYYGHKLTVGRATIGDDMVINHVDIGKSEADPKDFFGLCGLNEAESELVVSLMALAEGAKLLEQDHPAVYALQRDRILSAMENNDESGD